MRIARYSHHDDVGFAVDSGAGFFPVDSRSWSELIGAVHSGAPLSTSTAVLSEAALQLLAPVEATNQVICVGRNYRQHAEELGNKVLDYPTLFGKYPSSIIGPTDDISLPPESAMMDWEGELVAVIGQEIRRGTIAEAESAICGYTVGNDVTARDWQHRTSQWLQGKNFEATCPIGPWITTVDAVGTRPSLRLTTTVGGTRHQDASTDLLIFGVPELVAYVSTVFTLHPGDLILTGTPAGVGFGMKPPVFIQPDQVVETSIEGLGSLINTARLS